MASGTDDTAGGPMATTMMRVRTDLHARLQQLAQDEGVSMQALLDRALDEYRRSRIFARAQEAYAALRADPAAWQQELEERAAWDSTLLDGLEPKEGTDIAFA
jgi:hypothetical protein